MNRRHFVFGFLPLVVLAGCRRLVSPDDDQIKTNAIKTIFDMIATNSVADFLIKQGLQPAFSEQTDWPFYGGQSCLLMVDFSFFGQGDYEYSIDNIKVQVPINIMEFHPNSQKLTIHKNGTRVWGRRPPVRNFDDIQAVSLSR